MQHTDLQKLWGLADTAPRPKGTSRDATFERVGLILWRPPERATYHSTPANTLAFARTGGDGVCFSFILRGGTLQEDSPILMSVPMKFDRPNVVVGRDLHDFLALGLGCGFFELERIVYDLESFVTAYPATLGNARYENLALLRTAFDIEPWADPKSRLEELTDLEHLLEPPAPPRPEKPMVSPAAFWQAQLDRERSRPDDERDAARETHMSQRLAEEQRKKR